MKLWLIVPIKPFAEGKSRLAGRLSPSRRSSLSKQLFRHVITQALAAPELTGILVVSRDATVLDDLQAPHLYLIAETGNDLNRAIQQGREEALQRGADVAGIRLHRAVRGASDSATGASDLLQRQFHQPVARLGVHDRWGESAA